MGTTQLLIITIISDPLFVNFEQPGAWYSDMNRHQPNIEAAGNKITCLLSAMIMNNVPAGAISKFIEIHKSRPLLSRDESTCTNKCTSDWIQ